MTQLREGDQAPGPAGLHSVTVAPASQQWWCAWWGGLFCCLLQIWRNLNRILPSLNPLLEMHSDTTYKSATEVQHTVSGCKGQACTHPAWESQRLAAPGPCQGTEQHLRLPWEDSWRFLSALAQLRPLCHQPLRMLWEGSADATARGHRPYSRLLFPGQLLLVGSIATGSSPSAQGVLGALQSLLSQWETEKTCAVTLWSYGSAEAAACWLFSVQWTWEDGGCWGVVQSLPSFWLLWTGSLNVLPMARRNSP